MATPQKKYTTGSKSILAKLLATEDLSVVHESIPTAFFDVKNRVLHCPIFESMSGELYDLFMGHEVGHALFTPAEGWHSSIEESGFDVKFKGFLNVLEDARIEKLIKNKYPGLSRSFSVAYKDLHGRNFFGVLGMESFSSLNLIDRINLHFKCGNFLFITFTPEERVFVNEASNLSTWEDVVDLAKKVYEYVKANEQDKINNEDSLSDHIFSLNSEDLDDSGNSEEEFNSEMNVTSEENGDEEDSSETPETDAEYSESEKEPSEEESQSLAESDDDSKEEEEGQPESNSLMDESRFDEFEDEFEEHREGVESVTDKIYRKKEQELVIDSQSISHKNLSDLKFHVEFLDGVKLAKRRLKRIIVEDKAVDKKTYEAFIKFARDEFNKRNKSYINHIVQQFEMKKNAKVYSRTSESKSGVLDMKKIAKYRISSDIFLKTEKRERGKSHGLVMFLDVSGSMLTGKKLSKSIEHVLVLTEFCRKTNVPFEVYCFSSSYGLVSDVKYTEFDEIRFQNPFNGSITKLLSNQQTKQQYDLVYDMLLSYFITIEVNHYDILRSIGDPSAIGISSFHPNYKVRGINFGSTPINKTILSSLGMINKFKKNNLVDIVNVIHFTDGEGTDSMYYTSHEFSITKRIKKIILTDRDTGTSVEVPMSNVDGQQNSLTKFVGDITGCRHIGFFFADKKSLMRMIFGTIPYGDYLEEKRKLNKMGYSKINRMGYSDYYCVVAEEKIGRALSNKNTSKASIQKDFLKEQSKKYTRRLIANKFIENICE